MMHALTDGLRNLVSRMGTGRDKASHSHYVDHIITDEQLVAMYRTSAIARKIVDLPAEDSLREWREWQADAKQITKIEAEEKRLRKQAMILKGSKRARLFGGAAVYIATADQNLMEPLRPERIGLGGVKYLAVVSRADLTAGDAERDPRLPGYGQPISYTMTTDDGPVNIHPTRLVILQGDELPDTRFATQSVGWSDPALNACLTDVRNMDATIGNVASLVFEAKINVIGIEGFAEGLRNGGAAFEEYILNIQGVNARAKGISGDLLMDAKDTFTTRTASFATLPDIIDRFMQMTSAAASIPMTLLFGMSPGGLNATGDADTRAYYDRVKVMQSLELQPAMAILDECLIRSALGSRPADIFYNWRPLWMPTAKERADTAKVQAEAMKIAYEMDAVSVEASGAALTNAFIESGAFPGLESAVADFPVIGGDDLDVPDVPELEVTE